MGPETPLLGRVHPNHQCATREGALFQEFVRGGSASPSRVALPPAAAKPAFAGLEVRNTMLGHSLSTTRLRASAQIPRRRGAPSGNRFEAPSLSPWGPLRLPHDSSGAVAEVFLHHDSVFHDLFRAAPRTFITEAAEEGWDYTLPASPA